MLKTEKSGTLYIIPTPIGNLGDMTLRAIETMRSVDLLLTEDTRHTQKLLNHFDIKTKKRSYDNFSEKKKLESILNLLENGKSIALVSDAGMPGISDPGPTLVTACHERGIPVRVLPGPTAGITALVASGFKIGGHLFEGFLPREENKLQARLKELAQFNGSIVLYEAPHRVVELMSKIAVVMPKRKAHIARELTKLFEEHIRGVVSDVYKKLLESEPRGEYAIILAPLTSGKIDIEPDEKRILDFLSLCLEKGISLRDASVLYSCATGEKRSAVYRIMTRFKARNK